jgi:phage-related protein (TIGR01555 family)
MMKNRLRKENSVLNNDYMTDIYSGLMANRTTRSAINNTEQIINNNKTELISNNRNALNYLYVNNDIIQNLIDMPVDDAFRGGVNFTSNQIDNQTIKDIESFWEDNDFLNEVKTLCKWTRLFGGGGLIIDTNGNHNEKINYNDWNENTSYLKIKAADLWELFVSNTNLYYEEKPYVPSDKIETPYIYYGNNLHSDRVIRVLGKEAPSLIKPQLRSWGMSEVEKLIRTINQSIKTNNVLFEIIDEAKVSHYGIKGFNENAGITGGTEKVIRAITTMDALKSYLNSIVTDSEDVFTQNQLNFSSIADIFKEIRAGVACACKMPVSKLFGVSITGMNGGEDDIENYNGMIEGEIRGKYNKLLIKLFKLTHWRLTGIHPNEVKDLKIEYKTLRVLTSEQEENVKDRKFSRVMQSYEKGFLNDNDAIEQINFANLLPSKAPKKIIDNYFNENPKEENNYIEVKKKNTLFNLFRKNE